MASLVPSGLKASPCVDGLGSRWTGSPVATSKRTVSELRLPTARSFPSGLKTGVSPPATTLFAAVFSDQRRPPSPTYHTPALVPYPPVARSFPSGLKVIAGWWFGVLISIEDPVLVS